MLIVESASMDVYRNLAVEEYLMDHEDGHDSILFLWQSDCAVVMGKNQNPWKECRLGLMRSENVPLARRISGGGTVYHDAGNLNYCVIVNRAAYKEQQAYEMVFDALRSFGVEAGRTGKSNLSVDGLKFSGNAFCFRKGRAMHHGTLLLHTDLERLERYLGSMLDDIETHAIASVPAVVTNLNLDIERFREALKESFRWHYGPSTSEMHCVDSDVDPVRLREFISNQMAEEWQYGATPRFVIQHKGQVLEVVKNRVVRVNGNLSGESLIEKHFSEVAFSWIC
ncbi:MAG: lipoate--protein ligase family protein [Pontiellaceae bacterium]|nr:lipoate--protein ligase family protein [Pontiellaceae bacterium]MBN2786289.1 lipoate--protein ligase family protein [Pontiellaceae bacterium]